MLFFEGLPTRNELKGKTVIYKIECTKNKKIYIGATESPRLRCQAHRQALIGKRHTNEDMQHDFDKYGEKAFVFEMLFQSSDLKAFGDIEGAFMRACNSNKRDRGYNYKDPRFNRKKKAK